MPSSMTGYGKGVAVNHGGKLVIQIKTLNHRHSDIVVRASQHFLPFEIKVRQIIQDAVARGRVEVHIDWEEISENAMKWDFNQAKQYYQQLEDLQNFLGLEDRITLHTVLHGERVFNSREASSAPAEKDWWELIEPALREACSALSEMRVREGERLYADILKRVDNMEESRQKIADLLQPTKELYRQRIKDRLSEFSDHLDETRLTMEVALLIEKSDYTEELVRLSSHHQEIHKLDNFSGSVGKRLEFITQELKREINTIGSKALSPQLSRFVVDYKDELEKVREQLQNIE